ncbi:uncharacterized protein EDB93DRAFT_1110915 [Suillus bovinus]|uniref:uncharacterized protein n=1 Tax=Suillus bovinus TaxID=48563 RepID=UPI001B85F55C|nr:uncharacterized protein EDB93DRAFT_1110915 [Suillus bovinus]KAG2122951.1 hypothetical protein EDB93DRAFT_1110915 [Suillus bovinus]
MPELYPSPASTSDNQNSLNEYWPLTLTPADISATMSMSALCICASISQYQVEAANNNLSPLAWIRHFKSRLQWEITITSFPITSVCFMTSQIPEIHPGSYLAMIPHGGWKKLQSRNEPWQWDRVMTCCIFHYQHWLDGVENDGLTILEQVDHTSVPSLMGLRWIRERLLTLLEEQRGGIHDKMAEIQIYTAMLDRLKRGRGE